LLEDPLIACCAAAAAAAGDCLLPVEVALLAAVVAGVDVVQMLEEGIDAAAAARVTVVVGFGCDIGTFLERQTLVTVDNDSKEMASR
jgi:hypothetical protein